MTYIYDVLSNFNDILIEFYEWEKSDVIEHIKKIPFIKVSNEDYEVIAVNNARFKKDFLDSIKNKAVFFNNKELESIKYAVMITNGEDIIMIILRDTGYISEMSKLSYDEERDVLEIAGQLETMKISYDKLCRKVKRSFLTRQEKRIMLSIERELILMKDDTQKINYLYYEWFSKINKGNGYNSLIKEVKKEYTDKHEEFYKTIKLMSKTPKNV